MASPDLPPNRRGALAVAIALGITTVLVLLSSMVIVPPFSMALFPFVVGASEMSPFLVLLDLLWCLPANRLLRGHDRLRGAALALLVAGACIALMPFTQFNRVAESASAQIGTEASPPRFSLLTAVRGLPTSADIVVRTIPYRAANGSPLSMRLYGKSMKETRPTVVVIYGGAWRTGAPTQGEDMSRALATRGFTVAAIDYRHAPRSAYPAQIDDVKHSIALLRDSATAWGIDPAHMAVLGRSAGGHLAELAAYAPSGARLKALVSMYAPYDLVQGYVDRPTPDPIDVRMVLRDFLDGTPNEQPARYRAASPSTYVKSGLPPTLLIYGGRDHIVKPSFNRAAAAALRAARVPVVAVELPWAEHGFDMAPSGLGAQLSFAVIADFLERELKGK